MFFARALFLLAKIARAEETDRFLHRASLPQPHVGENGRCLSYEYDGEYVVTAHTNQNFSQLGYISERSRGIIKSIEPLKPKNYRIDVQFTFAGRNSETNAGFWLSEKPEIGHMYGSTSSYNGIGVLLSNKNSLVATVVDSEKKMRAKQTKLGSSASSYMLTLRKEEKKLLVSLKVGRESHILYDGPCSLPQGCHFSITSDTGIGTSPLRIFSISVYSIPRTRRKFMKGETRKNSWIILMIGFICIAWLARYLYQGRSKTFAAKS